MLPTMASEKFGKFLELLRSQPNSDEVKVPSMRRNMDAVGGRFPTGVSGTPVDVDGTPAEWIADEDADEDAVVLYLHGGGYVAGSIDSHRNLTGHLARAMRCRVLALDYRLAPEHPHPAAVEDATKAYRWLLAHGYDNRRIMISGDSAGGGLTVATLVALRDAGDPLPATAVAISPWVDMEGLGDSVTTRADADPMVTGGALKNIADLFLGPDGDAHDPLAAPLHADLSGLPPLLIHVGDAEVLLDDSTRLASRAEAAGVDVTLEVWPEMVHVWHASAGFVPESDAAIARIAEFSRPLLGLS
jgi:epsilon-lactone hydrolase